MNIYMNAESYSVFLRENSKTEFYFHFVGRKLDKNPKMNLIDLLKVKLIDELPKINRLI